jgi:hypothetical protein
VGEPASTAPAVEPSEPTIEPSPIVQPTQATAATADAESAGTATVEPEAFPAEATTEPVVSPDFPGGSGEGVAFLTDVRAGRHPGFDRVVWEFDGPAPSFRAEYAEGPVTESGSGDDVEVAGDAALTVTFSLASGMDLSGDEPVEMYTGPRRIAGDDAGTRNIAEVVETGDFESTLAWAVGVERVTPFTVTVLAEPTRIVLDVAR